jgi:hypothetical protein
VTDVYRPQPFWVFKGVPLGIAAVERRRDLVLGAALPPVVLVAAISLLSGSPFVPGPVDLVPPAASVFLGGPLARWAVRFKLPRVDPS